MNAEEKKIGLSLRAVGDEATRADVEQYKAPHAKEHGHGHSNSGGPRESSSSQSSSSTTLGDLINWKKREREGNLLRITEEQKSAECNAFGAFYFCRNLRSRDGLFSGINPDDDAKHAAIVEGTRDPRLAGFPVHLGPQLVIVIGRELLEAVRPVFLGDVALDSHGVLVA